MKEKFMALLVPFMKLLNKGQERSIKAKKNIIASIFIRGTSIGISLLLVPLTITGYASIGPAVVGHEGSTLIVVFNALRLLGYKKDTSYIHTELG